MFFFWEEWTHWQAGGSSWTIIDEDVNPFFWFWVLWGFLVLLCVILHLLWMYFQVRRKRTVLDLMPLPAESFYTAAHTYQFTVCAICLEEFAERDRLHWLPCSHVFHAVCVEHWIQDNHWSCPVCLTNLKASEPNPMSVSAPNYHTIEIAPMANVAQSR